MKEPELSLLKCTLEPLNPKEWQMVHMAGLRLRRRLNHPTRRTGAGPSKVRLAFRFKSILLLCGSSELI